MNNTELKPYDKVLVRDLNDEEWKIDFFSRDRDLDDYPYVCISNIWKQCIPYEGNESLLGTINTPKSKYEFKRGDIVLVWNDNNEEENITKYVKVFSCFNKFDKKFFVYDTAQVNRRGEIWYNLEKYDNCELIELNFN